jgi:hypothetical protein
MSSISLCESNRELLLCNWSFPSQINNNSVRKLKARRNILVSYRLSINRWTTKKRKSFSMVNRCNRTKGEAWLIHARAKFRKFTAGTFRRMQEKFLTVQCWKTILDSLVKLNSSQKLQTVAFGFENTESPLGNRRINVDLNVV